MNISHTSDTDLDVFLIAPDATRVRLFTDVGGGSDNFTDTILSDEAAAIVDNGGNLIGTALSPIDPLLGTLADNGGPTETHALLPGSPAIDAGDPSILFNPAEFDQRGSPFVRVVDGDGAGGAQIDIGAFEDNSSVFLPTVVELIRNGGGQNFDEMITLAFRFNEYVNVTIAALSMHNNTTDTGVDLTGATFNYDPTTFTAEWNLSVPDLPAAFYTATLDASLVTDADSNQLDGDGIGSGGDDFILVGTENPEDLLVAIPGDADLDGAVTINLPQPFPLAALKGDALNVLPNIGITSGALWADGDFDGDGAVTINIPVPFPSPSLDGDMLILLNNIGMSVAVPPPPPLAVTLAVFSSASEPLLASDGDASVPLRAAPLFHAESAWPVYRPLRKLSTREVDLALMELTDERRSELSDPREHDGLAADRDARRIDSVWDEAIGAILSGPVWSSGRG